MQEIGRIEGHQFSGLMMEAILLKQVFYLISNETLLLLMCLIIKMFTNGF